MSLQDDNKRKFRLLLTMDYKRNKYENLHMDLLPQFAKHQLQIETIEVSSLGLISGSNFRTSKTTTLSVPVQVQDGISRSVINISCNIYKKRNCDVEMG